MKKFPREFEFIAVEGAIGVEKTSFARILGKKLNAKIVLENVGENPFIKEFYQNPKEYAFITRLQKYNKVWNRNIFNQQISYFII